MKLRLATRGSPLALAQSGMVALELSRLHSGLEVEFVRIRTSGDVFADRNPAQIAAKGFFIKEIEDALLAGRADLAVHSAKDLPTDLPMGLALAAYPQREDPHDAFVGREGLSWDALKPGQRLGTSSPRRRCQILQAKPGLVIAPMRGNVDTRLERVAQGALDGIVLAEAGLRRLGCGVRREILSEEIIVPAPGQGALAVEVRADRPEIFKFLAGLDHAPTRREVETERAFLKAMGGGCSAPLGALARAGGAGLSLEVYCASCDGNRAVRLSGSSRDGAALAADLAGQAKARLL